ncbi:MAG: uroporphyrinogen-III C-methyltransferase, partial [SAR324 cluster bacterium]|nr:uroporphyrinogen-III C-methyltransferase [SAR324 cluster bacterium]
MELFPKDLPDFKPGWVWLAGAGPGDVGLLTLHALNALRQADVLVYDALVGEKIMELVSSNCELEYAGKRGGKPSPKQKDISLRLEELAQQGKRVLRLKGGDPFIFGRGGEEVVHLFKAGIPFRIIPGITAGIGGTAYAGIPLTHRDINSSVTFIAGRGSAGELPERHNWEAIAKGSPVIVMYMATKYIHEIVGRLLNYGRKPDEPVA